MATSYQFYTFPPINATTSSPSTGPTGSPAPADATEVGGVDSGGILRALKVDSTGVLQVDITSSTLTPLVTSDLADGSVTGGTPGTKSILTGGIYNTSFPTLTNGQQAAIQLDSSGRVYIRPLASATDSVTAIQGTSPWVDNISQFGGTNISTGTGTSGAGIPRVTVSNDSNILATQSGTWNINNISGTISLPTGAATSANQTNASQKTQIVDGSGNVIASTSNALNVNISSSTPTLSSNVAQFGGSNVVTGTGASGAGIPRVTVSNDSSVGINTGSNIIGKVGIDQTTPGTTNAISIADIGSNAVLTGNGTTGTGSQRVTIASDNTPFSVNAAARTPTALTITQASLTIGTSAVRLTVSGSAPASGRVVMVFTPDSASTAKFYIGASTVTNSGANAGIQIVAGQTFIANNDAGDYYVIASAAGQTGYVMEQS